MSDTNYRMPWTPGPRRRRLLGLLHHILLLLMVFLPSLAQAFIPRLSNAVGNHPSYLILASRTIRPGSVYRVQVSLIQNEHPLHVKASISRDGVEVSAAKHHFKHDKEDLLLKIPDTNVPGNYRLRVEGNHNGITGGTVFAETRELQFSPRFLTIIIQTNRAVYTADQTIRFRAVLLTTDMKPYMEPIDVNIVNPKGYVMKNFGSATLNVGVVSASYQLPRDPNRGWWLVQVVANNQVEEKRIFVEKYYIPRVEVFMQMPELALDTDDVISGTAYGWYLNNAPTYGNGTLRVSISTPHSHYRKEESIVVFEEEIEQFQGSHEFDIPLVDLERLVTPLPGAEVTAEFFVYDKYLDIPNSGYSKTRIIDGNVKLRFLGSSPRIFKPAMPFKAYIVVSYSDFAPLPTDKLADSDLTITRIGTYRSGRTLPLPVISDQIPANGIYKLQFDAPEGLSKMVIKVQYKDKDETAQAELIAFAYHSLDVRRLHVSTSTTDARVGEYVVLHVKGNFYMKHFDFVVSSKGIVVHSGSEKSKGKVKPMTTFSFPVSSAMAPTMNIVVYHVTLDGVLISDSIKIPVNPMRKDQFTFDINNQKDKTGNTLEHRIYTAPGDQIAVSSHDVDTSCINCGHEISVASVLESFHTFDEDQYRTNKVLWASRDMYPDKISYFDSPNYGMDEGDTFTQAGLFAFTDATVARNSDFCGNDTLLPCQDGTCFPMYKRCDRHQDCANGFDEANCTHTRDHEIDLQLFRMFRFSRFDQFYDPADGDWAWFDYNSNGFDAFNQAVPNRASGWITTAFHTNKDYGISVLEKPITDGYDAERRTANCRSHIYSDFGGPPYIWALRGVLSTFAGALEYIGTKPFCITVEMPPICRLGEQVGVRVEVFNFDVKEVYALVVLEQSDDYKVVQVEAEGYVTAYKPRTSTGEHHHLIWVQPGASMAVYIPIVPTRVGDITVAAEAWAHVGKDRVETDLTVEPAGATQFMHTSLLLDLKNMPHTIKFLDLNVTETPIVPYEMWRRYVFDSPQAYFSVVGDVYGPAFADMPMDAWNMLRKPDRTGEMQLFNFAVNLWTMKYLRLTNQLTSDIAGPAFDQMNYFYAYVMAFQHEDGYFTMFKDNEGSVWLTALVARTFQQSRFPDWENDISVDAQIIVDAVTWLLQWQTSDGSFMEPSLYPIDRKMKPKPIMEESGVIRYHNVSLTAQVLITLCDVVDLPGDLRAKTSNAKQQAMRYLERHLTGLNDPYELAIVAYALTRVNSVDKELAFDKLDRSKIEQEGHVYWAREREAPTRVVLENQRPYLQPRLPGKNDAVNVEATAYALLVYVLKEGLIQEQIVGWLNSMRFTDGGFVSTQDTIVALQALTEFTFRARIRDITDMHIQAESSAVPGVLHQTHITQDNLAQIKKFSISNVWGHVSTYARGAGFALLQLEVQYGVDRDFLVIPPQYPAFELDVSMKYSGKNNSIINVRSCQRWTLLYESPASGAAVVEIQTPSGYYIHQEELNRYVHSRKVSLLRRAKISWRFVTLYFKYLDRQRTCVDFRLQRYYPVANLTEFMKARVYDYYAPERFNETILHAFDLYTLSVCDVCGSYQCPYCPYFSSGEKVQVSLILMALSLVFIYGMQRWHCR